METVTIEEKKDIIKRITTRDAEIKPMLEHIMPRIVRSVNDSIEDAEPFDKYEEGDSIIQVYIEFEYQGNECIFSIDKMYCRMVEHVDGAYLNYLGLDQEFKIFTNGQILHNVSVCSFDGYEEDVLYLSDELVEWLFQEIRCYV